ncbi:HEPN domain-containing protein [Mycobacterium sp. PDNC021]|uniref:ApeA N-terminal domain 1-containing protein n=1 Tax=Mycobacterium sp. PDNC021 TaxID=3391399 RepID=UPI003AAF8460
MPDKDFQGYWWIPGTNPEAKVPGVLTIEHSGRSELALIGGFHGEPAAEMRGGVLIDPGAEQLREVPLIIGTATDGTEITLAESLVVQSGRNHQLVRVGRVLEGVHLERSDAEDFKSARVRIENLDVWTNFLAFARPDLPDCTDPTARLLPQDPVEFTDGGFQFRLRPVVRPFGYDLTRSGIDVVSHSLLVLEIEPAKPIACDAFDEVVSSWVDLVSFATGESCAITSFRLVHREPKVLRVPRHSVQEDGTTKRDIETLQFDRDVIMRAHWNKVPDDSPGRALNQRNFTIAAGDRPLDQWYAAWMHLRRRAKNALDILLSLTYGNNTFLQSDLLVVALGAETLHRDLWPGCLGTYPRDFALMIETAVKGLDEDDAAWIRGALRNEPSYAQRLRDLASIPAQSAVEFAIPDVEAWAQRLATSRNGLAHGLRTNDVQVEEMYNLMKRTRLLLELVVMQEIGVSVQDQTNYAVEHQVTG